MHKNTAAYRCQTESFTSKLSLNKKTSDLKFMNCMYKTFNVIWVSTCFASFIFSSFSLLWCHSTSYWFIQRMSASFHGNCNTEDTQTHTHTHTHTHTRTHTYSCTNTTRVSNCNLLVPLGVIWKDSVILNKDISQADLCIQFHLFSTDQCAWQPQLPYKLVRLVGT